MLLLMSPTSPAGSVCCCVPFEHASCAGPVCDFLVFPQQGPCCISCQITFDHSPWISEWSPLFWFGGHDFLEMSYPIPSRHPTLNPMESGASPSGHPCQQAWMTLSWDFPRTADISLPLIGALTFFHLNLRLLVASVFYPFQVPGPRSRPFPLRNPSTTQVLFPIFWNPPLSSLSPIA